TYSVVAYLDDKGKTQVARNTEGDVITPSVVLFEDNEVVVGKEAKKASAVKSGAIAEFVKRDMGKEAYSRPIHGEKLHPEVIQACILKKLKDDATAVLGPNFEAVITVPAYFDEPRRKATADAGEMAGLGVLDIVNEPTAAALSFGESLGYLTAEGEPREPMKVLVYDLGGGTFDVTLLDLRPGDLRTLATDGDVQLGGHDWDLRLVDYCAEEFKKLHHLDPRGSPASLAALVAAVEEAKHTLTARPKTVVTVRHGGHTSELSVSREKFEELTEDLLERTAYTTRQVLAASKLTWKDVNRVLLVGGSTRMPMVSRMIESLTSLKPDHTVNPDEAVARGAAIFAGYVIRRRDPNAKPTFKVVDVNAHSLGIEGIDQRTMRKENIIVIPRNSPLPAKVTQKFVTKVEDQISIVVQVLEGESKIPSQCSAIGRAVLRNLPEHLPKGWPVEVTYEYLTNGRLDVRAKLPGTSRGVQLELQREQTLTSERIGKWKKVIAAAEGFDAFEGMLDDVMYAHKLDRKQAQKAAAATIPAGAVGDEPTVSEAELSAASQAFAEVQAEIGGGGSGSAKAAMETVDEPVADRTATKSRTDDKPDSGRSVSGTSSGSATAMRPTAKPPAPASNRSATAAAAAKGWIVDRAATKGDSAERSGKKAIPSFIMWLLTIVAMLLVSLVALAVFYYLIANFTKMGDFLHLKLPGLPAPKAQSLTLIDFVIRTSSFLRH
ncbi:MAG TPA: Hsp70 family protein, partial [Pirellulales bacterium]|nr:Hsp70 family protein [Pirellulales bacterium]